MRPSLKNEAGNNYFVLSPQRWIELAITQMKSLLQNTQMKN
ncbi:MAG TPA: hypothetical protein VIJ95_08095 [Hanamia sp.]